VPAVAENDTVANLIYKLEHLETHWLTPRIPLKGNTMAFDSICLDAVESCTCSVGCLYVSVVKFGHPIETRHPVHGALNSCIVCGSSYVES